MDLGIIGLGRMGMGIGARLADRGHRVLGYDISPNRRPEATECGIAWVESVAALVQKLAPPHV
ncbi:MAG: NAD(P)-binding domain-containing protein, partial [Armatimonadota bacterium]